MSDDQSVQTDGIISDEELQAFVAKEIHRYLHVSPRKTREQLSEDSGVNIWTIDALRSSDPGKKRPLHPGQLISLCYAMGGKSVNRLLSLIGYGGAKPLGDQSEERPMQIVADAISELSVIGHAAADNRIDHEERPRTEEAADRLIATILPLSSKRKTA